MKKISSFFTGVFHKIVNWWKKFSKSPSFITILSAIISILVGVVIGLIILLALKPEYAFVSMGKILITGFQSTKRLGKVLYSMMPLCLTGLSVAFAFKTGLFNIGAAGQGLMGAFFGIYSAVIFGFPWWLALVFSIIGGAIWGAIPGLFKAYLNVNEVITSIMFNWIGLFMVNLILANTPKMLSINYPGGVSADRTVNLEAFFPNAVIPRWGMDKLFNYASASAGIIIAIIVAIIIYIILNKTTFGYELKAVGQNKNAAKYAGINEKRSIVLSMIIAGALAGLAGGLYYLNGGAQYVIEKRLFAAGFNGIPVALLASSNPIGVIFSSFFVSYIQIGGAEIQPNFSAEVINIIVSVIIYMSAFSLFFNDLILKKLLSKKTTLDSKADIKVNESKGA